MTLQPISKYKHSRHYGGDISLAGIRRVAALCLLTIFLSACGDDNETTGDLSTNVNANTTAKSTYATNIEVPHVENGTNYLIITKTDPGIGVVYSLEWDCMRRAQRWTCWQWTKTNSTKGWERKNWDGATWMGTKWTGDPFQPDPDIPEAYRTELTDYRSTGYDRGHICASEDRICSMDVNGQTFFLSNMHPQINSFNAAVWATMESRVRTWRDAVVNNGGTMYICKGGTIGDVNINGIRKSGVLDKNPSTGRSNEGLRMPVPKYFFMAILKRTAAGVYQAMAFWAEHKPDNSKDLTKYMITVNELESRTGYDFFCNLPDKIEESVEGMVNSEEWK